MKTKLIIEQHFHGAFGVDFNKASVDDVLFASSEMFKHGVGGIFPTLVTDSVENINRAVSVIKSAAAKQSTGMAKILGIHLEGIFINEKKKGIHNPAHFMNPTVENYKLLEDDFIKIVTLAPELCTVENSLIDYLNSKGVKVQAGHCVGGDLRGCDATTHTFNAMEGVTHRGQSTALSALINDEIFTEIIADGVHVSDDALKLFFKCKPLDKVLLVSDCLSCTGLKASTDEVYEFQFADEMVFYNGTRASSKEGTLAGSTTLVPDIYKRLALSEILTSTHLGKSREELISQLVENPYNYHGINLNGSIEWDENFNIVKVNA